MVWPTSVVGSAGTVHVVEKDEMGLPEPLVQPVNATQPPSGDSAGVAT